ncbi:unnamed protein product [Paramecium sonneborni]|uniref:Uncharacterized protein n=1 Tax=Paramecium sonneborni TaxID=65129 RepID=A0A8S1N669_9CILI|nr:unnamed protein product [Paramecium sonneborni]
MFAKQPRPIQDKNIYLIKSIEKQMLINLSKKNNRLKFHSLDMYNKKGLHWIIQSKDQNEQLYKFRFGEFVLIQNIKTNHPDIKSPFMLQCLNNINSQVFQNCSNNLVLTNPCLFKNIKNNLYLSIKNDEFSYQESPYYFQIISIKQHQDILKIERPILKQFGNKNFFKIRNYISGFSLSVTNQFQNETYLTSKSQQTQSDNKWQFIKEEQPNLFKLYNLESKCFAQDLSISQQLEASQIFLNANQPKHSWRILCPKKQELQFGIPFLIQQDSNGYYLTVELLKSKEKNINELSVVLKKNIETASLWIIFDMI